MVGFGVYVHWPFCLAKCPYCDFNSHVSANVDQEKWANSFLSEIDRYAGETSGRVLNSVYFGGGTPSLMNPDTVSKILDRIKKAWRNANDLEVTLEANPTSVEIEKFHGYRDAGVNRVSIGVQALNEDDLRLLGRQHSVSDAKKAVSLANSVFDRVSFDLIYGRQGQSLSQWKDELSVSLEMGVSHMALYQLTIEAGTAFGDRFARGKLRGLPNEDLSADMYEVTQDLCAAAGMTAYEVSNHAVAGNESRHNMLYWTGGDYVGIGPGAHGRLTIRGQRFATNTPLQPSSWLSQIESLKNGESSRVELSGREQANEYLMMALRLNQGVSLEKIRSLDSKSANVNIINYLQNIRMIDVAEGHIVATPAGRAVLNQVVQELLTTD